MQSKRTLIGAFADAGDGVLQALVTQRNFRIQFAIAVLALLAAAVLRVSIGSWAIIILAIGLVLGAELFNSCLENIVDLVEPSAHPLARSAKHAGAAAVLMASIAAAISGFLIYGQAIAHLLARRH
jgi:undecaprenol kinase